MMTEAELDRWGWAQYADRYWQRDDGEVFIALRRDGYEVAHTHRRYRHYAREVIATGVDSLARAIAYTLSVPVDQERAAAHRAYLTAARARDRRPAT